MRDTLLRQQSYLKHPDTPKAEAVLASHEAEQRDGRAWKPRGYRQRTISPARRYTSVSSRWRRRDGRVLAYVTALPRTDRQAHAVRPRLRLAYK